MRRAEQSRSCMSALACARIALRTAVIATVFVSGARAANTTDTTVSKVELQAKIAYCENCHGVSARGFHGYYPIPRLAGQQPEYIKNQLEAFVEHRRTNNIMFNVAHVLSPAMLDALTESFHNLNPKPLTTALPKNSLPRQENLRRGNSRPPTFRRAPDVTGRRPRARAISASGRAAERLPCRQTDQLGQERGKIPPNPMPRPSWRRSRTA